MPYEEWSYPPWECPKCHSANLFNDEFCGACHTPRPTSWKPRDWICRRCGEKNKIEDKYCKKCGEQAEYGSVEDTGLRAASQSLRESLRRQSKSILDEIQGELSASLKESAASLDRLSSTLPDLSEIKVDMPDIGSITPHESAAMGLDSPVKSAVGSLFEKVTTRNLKVEVQALPRLNYALVHSGLPLIRSLEIHNSAAESAHDVLAKAWVATDYGEPWQKSIASIPPGGSHVERDIVVPLRKSRLQEVREAERANLRIDVFTESELQFSETWPMEVLAYNEWYYHPAIPETIACFVQPNSEVTEKIVSLVRDRLRRESRETDLSGYQSRKPEKVVGMLEALYNVLQQDLKISYINPPPSFEMPEPLPDGGYTVSQKIFFPEQIYEHRRGTCLDLALLGAGCVERMGLHPLFFLIRGHAFFGAWLADKVMKEPVLRDFKTLADLLSSGAWLPLNSTTFASSSVKNFKDCQEEGRKYLGKPEIFQCAIDIASSRYAGIKPIPPLVAGG